MNCAEFEEILHDLDRPGTPGAAKRESALAHAESCSSCARLLTEAEALDFGLHTMAMPADHTTAPLRLEAALLREFRGRHGVRERQSFRWYAAVIGVAALALLAVGWMRVRMGVTPNQPPLGVPIVGQTAANTAGGDASSTSGVNSAPENEGLNDLASSEEGTGFVRLPYADDAASLEGGAVIRVAMPRSALASWGLPVSGVASTERIPAELIISADGMPQAIRLISQAAD
jgi:hypothetical protein